LTANDFVRARAQRLITNDAPEAAYGLQQLGIARLASLPARLFPGFFSDARAFNDDDSGGHMRYHVINPEDATATVSGESIEMTLNAIDDVRSPVSAQIQTTLSIETAEKLAHQLHTALMMARAHRANR
jgi:hypothetical protein